MNRSSWASGSGYVPSCSIGFWVAITKNGSGSGNVFCPTVTSRSCIACSSAAWVLGGVRLISSARMMFEKIGPSTNRNDRRPLSESSRTFVPVMSEGIRSGVNWIRLKPTSRILATELTIKRLGQSGHADQQDVAACEDRREDLLDHLALADDHLVQLAHHHVARVSELVEQLRDTLAGV